MITREAKAIVQPTVDGSIRKFGNFKPIAGSTDTALYALVRNADQPTSMNLLKSAGLMPFMEIEMLRTLAKDEQLKEYFKGKWFYLLGSGSKMHEICTINEDGSRTKGKGQSIENTIEVQLSDSPLALVVYPDDFAAVHGQRFLLLADCVPYYPAPIVVGKPPSFQANAFPRDMEVGYPGDRFA